MSTHWQCNNPGVEAGIGIGIAICIFVVYQLISYMSVCVITWYVRIYSPVFTGIYVHSSGPFTQQMLNYFGRLFRVVHRKPNIF